jgi:hypothetical protein
VVRLGDNKLITHASVSICISRRTSCEVLLLLAGYALFGFVMWPVLNNAISGGWMLILSKISLELRHPGHILCGRGRLANSRVAAQDTQIALGHFAKHPHF